MGNILKFFLNALKAIILSPFYIIYFTLYFIICFLNHIIGELRVLFSGFSYGSKRANKYEQALAKKKPSVSK